MKRIITVKGKEIEIFSQSAIDYISLTDIAKYKNPNRTDYLISNWLRNRITIEFLGIWEKIHNSDFNPIEFDGIRKLAGLNSFILTAKRWIQKTRAIGLVSTTGRYGGTYAHKDIALEFASWISVEFKLYLIKEFQRLKNEESERLQLDWNVKRSLTKINYTIHTEAIKENLLPPKVLLEETQIIYSSEADILNKALFGITAKNWYEENHSKEGNIRDYANVLQLVILANLEVLNAEFIKQKLSQKERLLRLNKVARTQIKILIKNKNIQQLR